MRKLLQGVPRETVGDLERLQLVLKTLPDEPLMCRLEKERVNRRLDVSFGFEHHFIHTKSPTTQMPRNVKALTKRPGMLR